MPHPKTVFKIPVSKTKYAIVDESDYEWLTQWKWGLSKDGYAQRMEGGRKGPRKAIYMHRVIMNTPEGMFVDHIDRNPLNNKRDNLRNVNKRQNQCNSNTRKQNKSGYKGVRFVKGRWLAQISIKGVTTYIGSFDTAIAAALAYDTKAIETQGEYARTNFTGENKVDASLADPRSLGRYINCLHCQKSFYVRAYRLNSAKYCSRACHGAYIRKSV